MSLDIVYTNDETVLSNVPSSLSTITIKASCLYFRTTNDKDYAFYNAKDSIETCYFEDNPQLQKISSYSFYGCSSLSFIDLEKCTALTEIGDYAFYGCSSLSSISFPQSLQYINTYSFQLSGLIHVLITKNVLKIGTRSFQECKSLETFEFENDSLITSISDHILVACSKITTFHIPKNLLFPGNTMEGCTSLASFTIDPNNQYHTLYDNGIYDKDKKLLYAFPPAITGDYTIPEFVTTLKTTAFISSKLSYVNFPSTLEKIENYCFFLSQIKELNLPSSLQYIDSCAFRSCSQLTKVVFPDGIQTIGDEVFRSCSKLQTVVFPSSLQSLGGGIFTDCPKGINITFSNSSNLKFDQDLYWIVNKNETSFSQCLGDEANYSIPSSFQSIGPSAFYRKSNLNKITFEPDSQLKSIGSQAFSLCYNLQTFEFPPSIETIGREAFSNCSQLEIANFSVHFNLQKIDEYAFMYCTSLTTLIFPTTEAMLLSNDFVLITLSLKSFYNCENLNTLQLGDCISIIGESCFQYCYDIQSVTIPSSCTSIGQYAFDGCSSLRECIFSEDSPIETLSSFLFNNCSQLSNITFPNNITTFESYSLANTAISEFILPPNVKTIGYASFQNCEELTTFIITEDSELTTIEEDVFVGCTKFAEINESCQNFELWNKALFNKEKTEFIILPPASGVVHFSFPETLRTIRSSSLQNVQSLQVVFIPDSVTTIGQSTFRNCRSLRYINIPSSVITIGKDAFEGCKSLQCGLSISNLTSPYVEMLTNEAKLPSRCLSQCIYRCTCQTSYINNLRILFSILITTYQSS